MPITNAGQIQRITSHVRLVHPRRAAGASSSCAPTTRRAATDFGVAYATLQCADLLANGAPGIHFYTLNRSPATRAILSALRHAEPLGRVSRASRCPARERRAAARRPPRRRRPGRSCGRCRCPTRRGTSARSRACPPWPAAVEHEDAAVHFIVRALLLAHAVDEHRVGLADALGEPELSTSPSGRMMAGYPVRVRSAARRAPAACGSASTAPARSRSCSRSARPSAPRAQAVRELARLDRAPPPHARARRRRGRAARGHGAVPRPRPAARAAAGPRARPPPRRRAARPQARRRRRARALVPPPGAGRDRRRGSTPPPRAPARSYDGLTIRGQKTRWASCSSRGHMSFNWRLLLAPEAVLDYVVEHEVCHLELHGPLAALLGAAGVTRPGLARARALAAALRRDAAPLDRSSSERRGGHQASVGSRK